MDELSIALIVIGGTVLGLGLISNLLARTILLEPTIALFVGILLGPQVLDLLDPMRWGIKQEVVLEQVARLTLGIGLFAVALRIPKAYPIQHWRPMAVLLGLGMPLMWLSSSLLVYLILGLPLWMAGLVGAIITPTDPIVASSIVTGPVAEKYIPQRLRNTISFESGANDGLAHPFVFLPLLIWSMPLGQAILEWVTVTVMWEVGIAVLFGGATGYGAGKLLMYAKKRDLIERHSLLAQTLALSLFVLGCSKLLSSNDILAVFVTGIMFDEVVSASDQAMEERVQEAVNRFFSLPIFILFGIVLPWQDWFELGWSGVILAVAIVFLRRLPFILFLRFLMPNLRSRRDALFLGWFGPVAIAALYYVSLLHRELGAAAEQVWTAVSLVIFASIVVHGMTATPLSNLYHHRSLEERET